MSNVLFLHHHEELWENGLRKEGTSIEEQTEKILDLLEHGDLEIDKVILTTFDYNEDLEQEQSKIYNYCLENGIMFQKEVYGYGMRKEQCHLFNEDEDEDEDEDFKYHKDKLYDTWCYSERCNHEHEGADVLDIEKFHKELLSEKKVYLAGAFEGECIKDQEVIFDIIGVNFERIDSLIVGSSVQYEFKGEKLEDFVNRICEEAENQIDQLADENDISEDFFNIAIAEADKLRDILEEFKDSLEDREESFEYGFVNSKYDELKTIIGDRDSGLDDIIEIIDRAEIIKENKITQEEKTLYHGSVWKAVDDENKETLDFCHDELEIEYNENEAVYLSDKEDVASFFALREDNGGTPVIFKIEMEEMELYSYNGEESLKALTEDYEEDLSLNDRDELYEYLKNENYEGFIIENNYQEHDGDDIAFFSDVSVSNAEVKAFIDGEWTEFMEVDDLKEKLIENYDKEVKLKEKLEVPEVEKQKRRPTRKM